MNDKRIDFMLGSNEFTKPIWKGFLAPDIHLFDHPKPPFPHLYIVNNAPTYLGGEHWCVLIVHEHFCEFFDSFGRSPVENGVFSAISNHCKRIKFNDCQYQSVLANTCGHHCIFFAIQRAKGFSCQQIKEMYHKSNFDQNDDMVFNFVVKNFGVFMARIQNL